MTAIRAVLAAAPFLGEGHRKVWARLRWQGVRTSKARVQRLMRAAHLLAPTRVGHAHGPKAHDGTITTEQPDQMWGMDATSCLTREGTATVFVVVDHCAAECIGLHAAKPGTRFEAVEPLRQGVHALFGGYETGIALGLLARHDHGSQYVSDYFQDDLKFLGLVSSPAFVREPEGNGVAERFIRRGYVEFVSEPGGSRRIALRIPARSFFRFSERLVEVLKRAGHGRQRRECGDEPPTRARSSLGRSRATQAVDGSPPTKLPPHRHRRASQGFGLAPQQAQRVLQVGAEAPRRAIA